MPLLVMLNRTSATSGETNRTLDTDALQVMTKEQRVHTDRPVTIEESRGIIRGRGLDFDNKAKRVRIHSQVSGTLQPQATPK